MQTTKKSSKKPKPCKAFRKKLKKGQKKRLRAQHQQAYRAVQLRLLKIQCISEKSQGLWEALFYAPHFSMAEAWEGVYELADELQQEAKALQAETRNYLLWQWLGK